MRMKDGDMFDNTYDKMLREKEALVERKEKLKRGKWFSVDPKLDKKYRGKFY